MALRTRDQAELVDAQISFHLNAGVDFVIATDHRSEDGTLEILEAYEREGCLRLIRETGDQVRGSEWRTRMARLAALEHGADWVIQSDGDEFWWPRRSSLKEVLAPVPPERGVVRGFLRLFPPRPAGELFFAERMVVRIHSDAPINDPASPFRPHAKVAHRGDPKAVVDRGAHSLLGGGLVPLHGFCPIDIFHFPVRSLEQLERRSSVWWDQLQRQGRLGNVQAHRSQQEGRLREHYASLVVSDEELDKGLAEGSLVVDTRLRDVLRLLRQENGSGPTAVRSAGRARGADSTCRYRPLSTTAAHAVDVDTLSEADAVRLQVRLDELELRLARRQRIRLSSVRVVMALFVRDEADVLDAQLSFHLNAGVDFVIATDHDSHDGTTEILQSYERDGYLQLHRDTGVAFRQQGWMTRLARLAATEQRADWVILSDADEFWWPRGGNLKEVLAAVPAATASSQLRSATSCPRPDDGQFFAERMTVRLSAQAPINDPLTSYRPVAKIAHRAYAGVVVGQGESHARRQPASVPSRLVAAGRVALPAAEHRPVRSRRSAGW